MDDAGHRPHVFAVNNRLDSRHRRLEWMVVVVDVVVVVVGVLIARHVSMPPPGFVPESLLWNPESRRGAGWWSTMVDVYSYYR